MPTKEYAAFKANAICADIIENLINLRETVMYAEECVENDQKENIKVLLNEINKTLDEMTIKYGKEK